MYIYIYIYIRIHVYYVICVFLHRYITYASRIFIAFPLSFIISLSFVDLFIEFHPVSMYSSSSGELLCGSELALFLTGGSDWRLCDECAMKIRTLSHLLESTAQIVACLKQNLCSVHEAGKPPVCAKQSCSFCFGWPFNGARSRVEAWPANQKNTRGFPALVLLETSHDLGCGLQEVILCSNFQCTLIAQSLVRPPSEEQSQLRSAEEFALLEEYIETGWNSMNKSTQLNERVLLMKANCY